MLKQHSLDTENIFIILKKKVTAISFVVTFFLVLSTKPKENITETKKNIT